MSVSHPVQSIIHHSSAPDLIIKPIHSHTSPPTHRPIGFHFLPSGMSVTSTDTPDEALQATARRSFYLKHVFFYLLSSSPHQQYLLQPDTVRLIPTKPDAPGCHIKTKYQQIPGAHFGTSLPGDALTLHRDLTRVLLL